VNKTGSPHGYAGARDLSGPKHSASGDPASSLGERALWHGYRNTPAGGERYLRLTSECACGGTIEAEDHPTAIAQAVEMHNLSTAHLQWRAWQDD
jgi:hypothetical protein